MRLAAMAQTVLVGGAPVVMVPVVVGAVGRVVMVPVVVGAVGRVVMVPVAQVVEIGKANIICRPSLF